MGVAVHAPSLQVILRKLVGRRDGLSQRYREAARHVDLTPFLGEGGGVVTTKGIRDPAGGFTVTLVDRRDARRAQGVASLDSLYGFVEPMDLVEIRMARRPAAYPSQRPPVVMRGFVSSVNRQEIMGSDGRPNRQVVISGQDYGKIAQMVQIFYKHLYAAGAHLLTGYDLSVVYGISFTAMPANTFIRTAVGQILNPWLAGMSTVAKLPQIGQFGFDLSVPQGRVGPYGIQPYQGAVAQFMASWADLAWNELFVEDRDTALGDAETGVFYVYRPYPWKDIDGNLIMPGAANPGRIVIDIDEVLESSLSHSDAQVANFFWVEAPQSELVGQQSLNVESLVRGTAFVADNPNADPRLYGLRKMQVRSNQLAPGMRGIPVNKTYAEKLANSESYRGWLGLRREQLKALHQDNVVFENGSFKLKGNERIRAGRYLQLTRGGLKPEYYVTQVQHQFQPFAAYTTEVTVERGTGMLLRTAQTQSPYLLEGASGPYHQP